MQIDDTLLSESRVENEEMLNFGRLCRRFHTLIWRPGDMVQNLESPGLSGRVDNTVLVGFTVVLPHPLLIQYLMITPVMTGDYCK